MLIFYSPESMCREICLEYIVLCSFQYHLAIPTYLMFFLFTITCVNSFFFSPLSQVYHACYLPCQEWPFLPTSIYTKEPFALLSHSLLLGPQQNVTSLAFPIASHQMQNLLLYIVTCTCNFSEHLSQLMFTCLLVTITLLCTLTTQEVLSWQEEHQHHPYCLYNFSTDNGT